MTETTNETGTSSRTVGSLNASDLGTVVAVEDSGRLVVGALTSISHDQGRRSMLVLVSDQGWRWTGHVAPETLLLDLPAAPEVEVPGD